MYKCSISESLHYIFLNIQKYQEILNKLFAFLQCTFMNYFKRWRTADYTSILHQLHYFKSNTIYVVFLNFAQNIKDSFLRYIASFHSQVSSYFSFCLNYGRFSFFRNFNIAAMQKIIVSEFRL